MNRVFLSNGSLKDFFLTGCDLLKDKDIYILYMLCSTFAFFFNFGLCPVLADIAKMCEEKSFISSKEIKEQTFDWILIFE